MLNVGKSAVLCRIVVDTLDLSFRVSTLLLDQCKGTREVGREVFRISEEVGKCRVDVRICWWLSAERAKVWRDRYRHVDVAPTCRSREVHERPFGFVSSRCRKLTNVV